MGSTSDLRAEPGCEYRSRRSDPKLTGIDVPLVPLRRLAVKLRSARPLSPICRADPSTASSSATRDPTRPPGSLLGDCSCGSLGRSELRGERREPDRPLPMGNPFRQLRGDLAVKPDRASKCLNNPNLGMENREPLWCNTAGIFSRGGTGPDGLSLRVVKVEQALTPVWGWERHVVERAVL